MDAEFEKHGKPHTPEPPAPPVVQPPTSKIDAQTYRKRVSESTAGTRNGMTEEEVYELQMESLRIEENRYLKRMNLALWIPLFFTGASFIIFVFGLILLAFVAI
ncbi:MAG: hypothetical protein M2R45_01055 [Verrucomicrobia subdivision 3 bacterium]|nr:hypothetical protein [Limisphaerales bacterium]MCS1414167.1 hypothetical protein [Limisphaerales bacterium]